MTLSALSICQKALNSIGISAPTTLVGTDPLSVQLLEIANETGRDLVKRAEWQALVDEAHFTSVATTIQTNLLTLIPYARKIVDNTMYNRTRQQRLIGPITSQSWQNIKATSISPTTLYWRLRGNNIMFPGTPAAGHEIYFEWVDRRWCTTAGGTTPTQEDFAADTDIPLLPDQLFILGVRWRFLQKKGLEYGEVFREYEDKIIETIGNDKPAETLNLNSRNNADLPSGFVQDGFWNI